VSAVRDTIRRVVPRGATILIISRGDPGLVDIDGVNGRHFPCDASGAWAGFYPVDDDQALEWLLSEADRGAQYLAVPATSSWWLDHYTGFSAHLARGGGIVEDEPDAVRIYRLGSGARASLAAAGSRA
jgi:hypothetical protein